LTLGEKKVLSYARRKMKNCAGQGRRGPMKKDRGKAHLKREGSLEDRPAHRREKSKS